MNPILFCPNVTHIGKKKKVTIPFELSPRKAYVRSLQTADGKSETALMSLQYWWKFTSELPTIKVKLPLGLRTTK